MSKTYQPLATKYRPQTFADVVGQDVATTTLKNAIRQGRISHAYLFSGMRGVGKTTTARLLAKSLNCLNSEGPTTEPCDKCESCLEIANGRSLDVLEIDAASNTSVDDVRTLQENLIYAPARDRYKVYIVDEVHMLSKSAFNAFLKTLEEPPEHVVFVFATTEINKIPPTVLSRCLVFDFGRVSSKSLSDRLKWICQQENIKADEAAIELIVFQSEGSIRDAISALDQVINFAGGDVKYEHALQALGVIDRDVLHKLINAVIDQNSLEAFETVRQVADIGADIRLFSRHLIRHIRDLMLVRVGGKSKELLPYSDTELELLFNQSQKVSEEELGRFFDILVRADEEMQLAATPQYHLEAALVKMIHSTRLKPLAELIAMLQSGNLPVMAAPARATEPSSTPKERNLQFDQEQSSYQAASAAAPAAGGNVKAKLVATTQGSSINSFLKMANSITLDDKLLKIRVSSSAIVKMLCQEPKCSEIRQAAVKTFGEGIKVEIKNGGSSEILEDEEPAPPAQPEPPPESYEKEEATSGAESTTAPAKARKGIEEQLKNDPLTQTLFQEFDLSVEKVRDIKNKEN